MSMPKFFIPILLLLFPIFAFSQIADFKYQSTTGTFCNPSTIQFTQTSTGNPVGFVWDFGNNTKGYDANVSVNYSNSGNYKVKLIVIYDQYTVEISKVIIINPAVNAAIVYDKNYICKPGAINFTASSSGSNVKYTWNFDDSSALVTTSSSTELHNYNKFGSFTVKLKATDTTGCEGFASTPINVIPPPIAASVSPASGCIPAVVNFNSSVNLPANDFVKTYRWDFGDSSTIITNSSGNINYIYNKVGTYLPKLNIITNSGCTNNFNFQSLAYGTPPINHIAYPQKAIVCGSEYPLFIAKAINANYYVWDFGDSTKSTVYDTLTKHKYATLGFKTLSVTPYFNNCPGITISFKIEVIGVIAAYDYYNTCNDKKTYSFTNLSKGSISASLWKFGDGATLTTKNAMHSFPQKGNFSNTLTITDSTTGCTDTYAADVYTANPQIKNTDSSICRNAVTEFTAVDSYPFGTYNWNVVGLIHSNSVPKLSIKASNLGSHNNFVAINYGTQNCIDTVYFNHPLIIKGPDLNFDMPTDICLNATLNVKNNSNPFYSADTIKLWHWNFGNSIRNDTIFQPQPFKYRNQGSYAVKLTGIDKNGCEDSLIKIIQVNTIPFLKVIPNIDTLCEGGFSKLKAFSNESLIWSPNTNISCINCDSVFVNPKITTNYFVTATNQLNCSIQDTLLIKVYNPFKATSPAVLISICKDDKVTLDVDPKMKKIVWTPSTGLSNPTIYNPVLLADKNVNYTARLTDSVGCFSDSINISINVKTLPTVDAGPDKSVAYNSNFSIIPIYSNNIMKYEWSPSSLLFCNNCANPKGIALYGETYNIKVTSDSGCIATDKITIYIECKNANILIPSAFSPNNDNLNDTYYPNTRGFKTITKFAIYNRQGILLFEARDFVPNNKLIGWNGYFKGQPQPASAYVYIIEAICDMGTKIIKTGSFVLVR